MDSTASCKFCLRMYSLLQCLLSSPNGYIMVPVLRRFLERKRTIPQIPKCWTAVQATIWTWNLYVIGTQLRTKSQSPHMSLGRKTTGETHLRSRLQGSKRDVLLADNHDFVLHLNSWLLLILNIKGSSCYLIDIGTPFSLSIKVDIENGFARYSGSKSSKRADHRPAGHQEQLCRYDSRREQGTGSIGCW